MAAGEKRTEGRGGVPGGLRRGARRVRRGGDGGHFPHHAGHGLGLSHPEAPFLVRHSTETLVAGDVVTLEPGLYVDGVGGVRIEHNYLVTDAGFERLSNHVISLSPFLFFFFFFFFWSYNPPMIPVETLTIVGVGLIGGSVGLAAKARGVAGRVVGVGRDRGEPRRSAGTSAPSTTFTTDLAEGVAAADLIVVCTPVDRIAEPILEAAPHAKPGRSSPTPAAPRRTIVARAGRQAAAGVVRSSAAIRSPGPRRRASSTPAPICSRTASASSDADGRDRQAAVERCRAFWQALGCAVVHDDPGGTRPAPGD